MKTTHTILIVDDDIDILEALKIYLSKDEYQLLTARNGKDAVDIVKTEDVDLVLMDIMMPIMDGIKATKEIRNLTNIPIILLTAKSEDQDKVNGLDIGADDYITKPFNPSEVLARVNSQLRRYHQLGGVSVTSLPSTETFFVVSSKMMPPIISSSVSALTPPSWYFKDVNETARKSIYFR